MENEKVEETGMSFSDILFLLKKNILLIVILTVVMTILGGVYGFVLKKPTYTGTVTAIVMASESEPGNHNNTADYVYAEYYTGVFKSLIESNPVMSAAQNKLEKDYDMKLSRDQVRGCINIQTQNNSLIITISAKVKSKDDELGRHQAQVIANSVIDCAIAEANKKVYDEDGNVVQEKVIINGQEFYRDKYVYGVYANKLVTMEYVEDPADVSYHRGAGTTIIISFLIGLILSFGIILIKYLADDTFTSKEGFEKRFNIQVLSVIEEMKSPEEGGNK